MSTYRIAIIAPITPIRSGIAELISPGGPGDWEKDDNQIVYQASYLADIIDDHPQVDLLLITGDAINKSDLILLKDSYPDQLSILVLGEDPLVIDSLMKLSLISWGLLSLDSNAQVLDAAIQALKNGLVVTSSELLPGSNYQQLRPWAAAGDTIPDELSPREIEVLDHLARGLANKQIAYKLEISEHTVKFHISSIYSKLGVNNRAEAVRVGIKHGYVSI